MTLRGDEVVSRSISDPSHADLQATLAGIRSGFLDRLGDRLLEVEALLIAIDRDGPTEELMNGIASRAHKTAGVAPSLGLPDLGALARDVEVIWSRPLSGKDLVAAKTLTEAFLDEIERALDES